MNMAQFDVLCAGQQTASSCGDARPAHCRIHAIYAEGYVDIQRHHLRQQNVGRQSC